MLEVTNMSNKKVDREISYLAIGTGLGIAFGVIYKNLALGLIIGIAIGAAIDFNTMKNK